MNPQDKQELLRRIDSARADLVAVAAILAKNITDPTKPTKPAAARAPVRCFTCECWIDLDTDHAEGCVAK